MAITFSVSPDGDEPHSYPMVAQALREALPYIDSLKEKTLVIKIRRKYA